MKQFGILFRYECSKLTRRKSFWIIVAGVVLFYLFMIVMPMLQVTFDMGDGYTETYLDRIARDRKNGLKLTGRRLDDELLQEAENYENELGKTRNNMSMQEWENASARYSLLEEVVYWMTREDLRFWGDADNPANPMTAEEIYNKREQWMQSAWGENKLTQKEREYWQKKEDTIEKPIRLQHSRFYNFLVEEDLPYGFVMICFFIAAIISQIFAEEHTKKMDQLILSSRFGRKPVYYAKVLTGIVMTMAVTVLVYIVVIGSCFLLYGAEGFDAVVQQAVGWSSSTLTMGQAMCIMLFLQVIAVLLTAIIVMVLSEWLGNRIAPMAFVVASMFAAAAVAVPEALRVPSQSWSYLPMNLVRLEEGILDVRLISIGQWQFTTWQFGPVLYLVLGVLLFLLGRRLYCNYQVK